MIRHQFYESSLKRLCWDSPRSVSFVQSYREASCRRRGSWSLSWCSRRDVSWSLLWESLPRRFGKPSAVKLERGICWVCRQLKRLSDLDGEMFDQRFPMMSTLEVKCCCLCSTSRDFRRGAEDAIRLDSELERSSTPSWDPQDALRGSSRHQSSGWVRPFELFPMLSKLRGGVWSHQVKCSADQSLLRSDKLIFK